MRILHLIPSVDPAMGGPAEGLKQFCAIFHGAGFEVEVATLDSPVAAERIPFPARVHALGPGAGVYGYSSRALPWLRENLPRFDLLMINGVWQYNAIAGYKAAQRAGIPYGVFTHGMLDPYFKHRYPLKHLKKSIFWHLALKSVLNRANGVLFTTEEEKILARQSFSGYKVREIVVPYGTYGPDCGLEAGKEEFFVRWPDLRGKRLAISLGRIHPKKGTDLLIQSFAQTLGRDPEWRLVIAGPDQVGWRAELESMARSAQVAEKVIWTGMLKGPIKWGSFAAAELFVLPSHQENFGIVVAEALACGTPVAVSDKVNIWREIVEMNAGLAAPDTLEGSIDMMNRWQALTPDGRAEIRGRARACFDKNFNYEATSKRLIEIVNKLAHERATRS